MAVMTAVDSAGRFTRADLWAMPDDGRRYELLDGAIIVSPPPRVRHQRATFRVALLLRSAAPPGLEVLPAPLGLFFPDEDYLEPDVMVFDPSVVEDDQVQAGMPLLVVEVLSPSSRRRDVGDKLTRYRDAGVPSYWVVDPINPRLRAWRLEDGAYVEIADVHDEEEWTAEQPFAVTIRPVDLTRHG
jgi:Uma2 family endonuclease